MMRPWRRPNERWTSRGSWLSETPYGGCQLVWAHQLNVGLDFTFSVDRDKRLKLESRLTWEHAQGLLQYFLAHM